MTTMGFMARLGYMLYILSWIVGAPLITFMVYGWATGMDPAYQVVFGALGIVALTVGRGVHYVLTGD